MTLADVVMDAWVAALLGVVAGAVGALVMRWCAVRVWGLMMRDTGRRVRGSAIPSPPPSPAGPPPGSARQQAPPPVPNTWDERTRGWGN